MKYFYRGLLFAFCLSGILVLSGRADTVTEAEKSLDTAIQSNDIAGVKASVRRLTQLNTEPALTVLLKRLTALPEEKYELYWSLVSGLAEFNNEATLSALADFIITNTNTAAGRDALFILKSNQTEAVVKILVRVLEKGPAELRSPVLTQLSEIKSKKSVEALVNFLQQPECQKEEELQNRTLESLQSLLGPEIGATPESVNQWWAKHRNDKESALFTNPVKPNNKTDTVIDRLDYVRVKDYGYLKTAKDRIVVVVSDCPPCENGTKPPNIDPEWDAKMDHNYDHIENALARMNIPYVTVKKSEFDTAQYKLDGRTAVLFNCNAFRHNKLSDAGVKKIQEFVAGGGYFFSEDWVLEEVLERAFKGLLTHTKYYPEKDVVILPAPGAAMHPYMKGVFEKPPKPGNLPAGANETIAVNRLKVDDNKWHIDEYSPDIKILAPDTIEVLLVAPELRAGGKDSCAVALTFAYGPKGPISRNDTTESDGIYLRRKTGGRVLHVLSHFGHQAEPTDELALQNLLLNFLLEAARRRK